MIGGHVQQRHGHRIEVLCSTHFDRVWRLIDNDADVQEGDYIWWQGFVGYRTRGDDADRDIGSCRPASPPWVKEVTP